MSSDLLCELARNVEVVGSSPNKGLYCFLEQETLPYCLVLVGSSNGFERDFTRKIGLNVKQAPSLNITKNQTMLLPNLCH